MFNAFLPHSFFYTRLKCALTLTNFWLASCCHKKKKITSLFFLFCFFQPLFSTVSSSVGYNNSYHTLGHYYNYKMLPVHCSAQRVEGDFRPSPRLLLPLFQILLLCDFWICFGLFFTPNLTFSFYVLSFLNGTNE